MEGGGGERENKGANAERCKLEIRSGQDRVDGMGWLAANRQKGVRVYASARHHAHKTICWSATFSVSITGMAE